MRFAALFLLLAQSAGPQHGALVIVGGGKLSAEIKSTFVKLAGGYDANFVVVPTAGEDREMKDLDKIRQSFLEQWSVKNVTVIHTRDRAVADTDAFAEPLRNAAGVWFPGGRQWRLADSYLGTKTESELRKVLDRGGVIGGSSAGATILGSYLVRGAPEGNTIMMAPGHEKGFGFLTNSAIDQHVLARKRDKDLIPVIEKHPDLLGIGIDESTAIVVHANDFEVIGASKVLIHKSQTEYETISPGAKFDLRTRTVIH